MDENLERKSPLVFHLGKGVELIKRRKSSNQKKDRAPRAIINERIRDRELMIIDQNGNNLGKISKDKALELAAQAEMDLVLVGPKATPPVAKIMDYGKYKFQQEKKLKEAKKNRVVIELKEIKLRPKIGPHDLETKLNHAKKFLSKGNKVKITMEFRGREMAHQNIGSDLLDSVIQTLEEVGTPEAPPKTEGRKKVVIICSK